MQISLGRSKIGMLAFLSLFYSLTSCLEAEERPVNFGPEVPAEEVIKVLREPMGKMEHNQIGKNEKMEKMTYIFQPNVPNPQKYLLRVENREVIEKVKMTDRYRYKSKIKETTWEDGKPVERQNDPEKGPYDDFALFADDASDGMAEGVILSALSKGGSFKPFSANKTTFHDLHYSDDMGDLPSKVKDKTNCANVPDCKIKVRKVTITMVDWDPDGPVKHDLEFVVSGQTPFFSKILKQCDTWIMKTEQGPLLVTMCGDTTDFETGTNPWPATEVP